MVQPLWRTLWRFLKKLHIELPYDPAIPLLGIYLEENMVQKDTWTPIFTATLFTIAKIWKQWILAIHRGYILGSCHRKWINE